MKELLAAYFNLIFKAGIVVVVAAALFLFLNLTTDFYDTPKFIILLLFVGVFLILLTAKFTLQNKVTFIRTPLDLPLLLLTVVAVVSTFLSSSPYVSMLGNQARVYPGLVSLIVLVVFYFLLTNNLGGIRGMGGIREIGGIFKIVLLGGAVLSVLSLLSYFNIRFLPSTFGQAQNFTPTGLTFTTTAVLALLLPFPLIGLLAGNGTPGLKDLFSLASPAGGLTSLKSLTPQILNSACLLLFGLTIALTGSLSAIVGASLALGLGLIIAKPDFRNLNLIYVAVPVVLIALVAALSFIPPVGGAKNPLYDLSRSFPREIQLDLITSWKVVVSSFRDHPFWGSGPASFLFDFTNYKPIEFNSSKFWNIRFDSAFNEYFQALATLGGVGLLALVSLAAMFISSVSPTLINLFRRHSQGSYPISSFQQVKLALAISGITFFVILALHASTLIFWIVGLLILASFSVANLKEATEQAESSAQSIGQTILRFAKTSISQTSEETIKIEALPGVLLILALGVTVATLFFGGKFILADYHHRLALVAVSQNDGLKAYNELVEAEKLNGVNDLYRGDLAQVNFALANAIAVSKAPSEASPAGSLTDQDRQNIQVLLQQSINEARTAVTLSPRSAINWEVLAQLYRQIAGVAENALLFSLDSFGRAIFQDPLNPNLRLNVGGTYYAIRNYDLAIRFFTDAINLKPDFANGYYNLSVALRDKGDLNAALQAAEEMIKHVDASSSDYKVATDYLNDLKNKVSPPTPPEPPAAETSGALQQEELPDVVNLPKPSEIATPSAIKKPGATPEPTPQP